MAKARRGRAPLPRARSVAYAVNSAYIDERTYKTNFGLIMAAFNSARLLRHNEAANLARYLLGIFDLKDVQTSVSVDGEGYDYTVSVSIADATMELIQGRAEVIKLRA